jgi:hypothetical protein
MSIWTRLWTRQGRKHYQIWLDIGPITVTTLTVVLMKIQVCWDMIQGWVVNSYWHFARTCCFSLQGRKLVLALHTSLKAHIFNYFTFSTSSQALRNFCHNYMSESMRMQSGYIWLTYRCAYDNECLSFRKGIEFHDWMITSFSWRTMSLWVMSQSVNIFCAGKQASMLNKTGGIVTDMWSLNSPVETIGCS